MLFITGVVQWLRWLRWGAALMVEKRVAEKNIKKIAAHTCVQVVVVVHLRWMQSVGFACSARTWMCCEYCFSGWGENRRLRQGGSCCVVVTARGQKAAAKTVHVNGLSHLPGLQMDGRGRPARQRNNFFTQKLTLFRFGMNRSACVYVCCLEGKEARDVLTGFFEWLPNAKVKKR